MNIAQALRLAPRQSFDKAFLTKKSISGRPASVALVGAGGKTTALFQLARILNSSRDVTKPGEQRLPVIVTVTTHLGIDQLGMADFHWIAEEPRDLREVEKNLHGVILVTGPLNGARASAVSKEVLINLRALSDSHSLPLLMESDGSRRRPLKAPAAYEPAIPGFVETVVVVAGLSGLDMPLNKTFVHRPDIFASLSGLTAGQVISPQALAQVLAHPYGGLKGIPRQARRIALLNQADTPVLQAQAKSMAEDLLSAYQSVVVASMRLPEIYAVEERIAGILLAGGESKRFGRPKQLLEYHGQPFVRAIAQKALASGLSPLIVVTGASGEEVESAVKDLPITIVHNPDWQTGQSSSIRAGLTSLPGWSGAAVFLLADQPQVSSTVIQALIEEHARTLAPIIAPLVVGKRANPVLFDRETFPDLQSLSGDIGGRAIFSKYPVRYLPWHAENLLLDIDTPADLEKLEEQEK